MSRWKGAWRLITPWVSLAAIAWNHLKLLRCTRSRIPCTLRSGSPELGVFSTAYREGWQDVLNRGEGAVSGRTGLGPTPIGVS